MDVKKIILITMLMGMVTAIFAGGVSPLPLQGFQMFTPKRSLLTTHFKRPSKTQRKHYKQHLHQHYVEVYPGSLKMNVLRLARVYGWKQLIWLPADDYHWIGKVRIAAHDLPDILGKILKDYPLQANFYAGNHVLVIKPRTLT